MASHGPNPAGERWIVIPHWDSDDRHEGFQHYGDRDPVWIKNYRSLLAKEEYIGLTWQQRGLLHSLWLEYAASDRQVRDSTATLTRRFGQRVTRGMLDSLNHAGFIRFSASKPLARRYPRKEVEKEKKRARTHAGKGNVKTGNHERGSDGIETLVATLIRNGTIRDQVDLDAELRAHGVNGEISERLRQTLPISNR